MDTREEMFEEDQYVDVSKLPLKPPQPQLPPEKPVRRPWHPVVWDDSYAGVVVPDKTTEEKVERLMSDKLQKPSVGSIYESQLQDKLNSICLLDLKVDDKNGLKGSMLDLAKEEERPRSKEYPHKQRIRNLKRLIAEGKVKPSSETVIFFLCNKFAISKERQNQLTVN